MGVEAPSRASIRLPRARSLDSEVWEWRHRWLLVLLWAQAAVIAGWSLAAGYNPVHGLAHVAFAGAMGIGAAQRGRTRTFRSVCVALGLFAESAVIVHLADGAVAAHFHFFVMLAALSLYEDAVPFIAGLGFVLLEHGIIGTLDPRAVYNDDASIQRPWFWAAVHGGFVGAAAGIQVLAWNANERVRQRLRQAELRSASERDRAERYLRLAGSLIVALDADGRIDAANELTQQTLGYTWDELAGADWFELAPPAEDRDAARGRFARRMDGHTPDSEHIEAHVRTRTGERRLIAWHLIVLRDETGRPTGTLSSGLDVTEERAIQAQVAALAEVTRRVAHEPDARMAVLEATCELTGAAYAVLAEPGDPGTLALTVSAGLPLPVQAPLQLGREPSGAEVAFTSGEPLFVPDAAGSPAVSQRVVEATGTVSLLFQPAKVAGVVRGVLVVAWKHRVESLSSREAMVCAVLADEMALAIDRAGHLRELERAAATDPLTGVGNRRAWEDALRVEIARAERGGERLSVVLLDLDGFKAVNDAHGHQAGDRTLKECVATWRSELRPTDVFARLGGDEFGVLLPGCRLEEACAIGERLTSLTPHAAGVSIGVATWEPGDATGAFVRRADTDLYERKSRRRVLAGG